MLKIKDKQIDLILQLEDHSNIDKIFNSLTLDISDILLICPELFLQRFIGYAHENISESDLESLEEDLSTNNGYSYIDVDFKGKNFCFHFIITSTEITKIPHPIKGLENYQTCFKVINI